MARSAEKQARSEAILGELAELGLMLARDLATQARACEDPAQQAVLVDGFHKTSRAVRLTIALDAKLDRNAARDAAEESARAEAAAIEAAASEPFFPPRGPAERRKDRVRGLMNRLIWNESEGDSDEYDVLYEDLSARLDEAALAPDFEDIPVETLARRIAADMGLPADFALSLCEPAPPIREPEPREPVLADTG